LFVAEVLIKLEHSGQARRRSRENNQTPRSKGQSGKGASDSNMNLIEAVKKGASDPNMNLIEAQLGRGQAVRTQTKTNQYQARPRRLKAPQI